jgi:hypothetical protein
MKYLVLASILLLGSCTQRFVAGSSPKMEVREIQRNFPGYGDLWEKERSSEIEERVAAMEKRIKDLKELIVELKIAELERKDDDLNSNVENQENPSQVASVPMEPISIIMGFVTGVSTRVNLIVINVGDKQGVHVAYKFTIFRGSSYIGRLIVEKVYPQQSAGRVLLDETIEKAKEGDSVIWIGNR